MSVETYHYVFGPLVNAALSGEKLRLNSSTTFWRVDGESLKRLWHRMQSDNMDVGNHWANAPTPSEAVFVVKEYPVVCEDGEADETGLYNSVSTPPASDVFRKERACLNLSFDRAIATPIAFCSDDFPVVRKMGQYWDTPDIREDWDPEATDREQVVDERTVPVLRKLMTYQAEEFLEKREWLNNALTRYDEASGLGRKPKDGFADYVEALEALFTEGHEGISDKLATRVAMALADEEEYSQFFEWLKKAYTVSSKKRHGRSVDPPEWEKLPTLRKVVRQSILVALGLSREIHSGDWTDKLLPRFGKRDKDLIEQLGRIRKEWNVVW